MTKKLVTLLMSTVLILLGGFGCATTRPVVTLCVVDVGASALDCYDAKSGSAASIPFTSADKYVCVTPDDFRTLVNSCGLQ